MIERVLLRMLREKVEELSGVFDEAYSRWYEKCVENLRKGNLTLYGYSKVLDEVQKKLSDVLSLVERLSKIEKEIEKVGQVDEVVMALAYSIMELDEKDRKKIANWVKRKLDEKAGK